MRSKGAYFEGDCGIIVLCIMCLVSSPVNVSIFHIIWLYTFWADLVYLFKYYFSPRFLPNHFFPIISPNFSMLSLPLPISISLHFLFFSFCLSLNEE